MFFSANMGDGGSSTSAMREMLSSKRSEPSLSIFCCLLGRLRDFLMSLSGTPGKGNSFLRSQRILHCTEVLSFFFLSSDLYFYSILTTLAGVVESKLMEGRKHEGFVICRLKMWSSCWPSFFSSYLGGSWKLLEALLRLVVLYWVVCRSVFDFSLDLPSREQVFCRSMLRSLAIFKQGLVHLRLTSPVQASAVTGSISSVSSLAEDSQAVSASE